MAARTYGAWGIVAVTALAGLWLPAGRAEEVNTGANLRESTSLQMVPDDAAFFRACLRNEEQVRAVFQSRAIQRLLETPSMAEWLEAWRARWNDPNGNRLRQWFEQPENRELVNFAVDALTHEVFWYGDASFADLVDLSAQANQASMSAQREALRRGRSLVDSERIAAHVALRILADNPDRLCVPATVIGFKVTDTERARRQIDRLEDLLRTLLRDRRPWIDRLRREQIAGAEFLTWPMEGSMLPWDMVPKGELEQVDPELRRRVEAILNSKRATVSIGVRGDYLLISLGETNDHLQRLETGPWLLDRPEFQPLRQVADQPLTSIVYISQEYRARASAANKHQIYGSFLFEEFLKHPATASESSHQVIDPETRGELVADMRTLSARAAAAASSQGATLRFSFLTERGYEGYWYDWSETTQLDGSQPLTVLNHVGGEPLGFLAARRPITMEDYDQTIHGLGRAVYYFEKIGLKQMDARRQAAYADLRRQAQPLLARLDRANRQLLLPALADGQMTLVLEADVHNATEVAPRGDGALSPASLPRLHAAFVCGVSDPEKFKQGCQEYLAVADKVWSGIRAVVEEVQAEGRSESPTTPASTARSLADAVPRPTRQVVEQGELYSYPLSEHGSFDGRVAPNVAISDKFAVFSYLPAKSLQLLEPQPLGVGGVLADTDRALAAAAYLDFAGLVDIAEPWLMRAWEKAELRRQERQQQRMARSEPLPRTPEGASTPSVATKRAPSSRTPSAVRPEPRAGGAAATGPSARIPPRPLPPPQPNATQAVPARPQPPAQDERVIRGQAVVAEQSSTLHKDRPTFRRMMDVLRCFRGLSCVVYQENDAMVTHYELRFEDLAE